MLEPLTKELGALLKGYEDNHKPFLLIDNTINEKSSTQTKGVDEMKNIYKRKDGRYEYSKMINYERIYFISKYRNKVEQKVREYNKGNKEALNTKNFKNIVLEWYNNFKRNSIGEKAKEQYKNTLYNYILPKFESKTINKITYKDLQLFVNNIDKTRVREIVCQHLKAIFNYAYSNRYILVNPTVALKLPKKTSKAIVKPLTFEEQKNLLGAIAGHELETFLIFSLVMGTRRNETLAFKIEDINQAKQTIHINGTKTENAERDIKISKDMINYLLQRDKHEQAYFNFTSEYVTKRTSKILKSIGIDKSLHALRHTCATNLFYLNWKDKQRQQYLGHANITTTNNIYTFLENDIKTKDVRNLYKNLYYEFDDNFDDK